jgi:hypothetical protein
LPDAQREEVVLAAGVAEEISVGMFGTSTDGKPFGTSLVTIACAVALASFPTGRADA